jgi:hypothetical protein
MRKLLLSWIFALAVPLGVYAQTIFTQENLPLGVCMGTHIINGDLRVGQVPNGRDNTINGAFGFSAIWGSGSSAEYYSETQTPIIFPSIILPTPVSGNYVSCWIANNNMTNGSANDREGFMAKVFGMYKNTGSYTLTFDMACLDGFGTAELGVYGVFNSSSAYSTQPTGVNVPTNMNLFGASNTVLVGNVLISGCGPTKNQKTVTINTNALNFPTNGITHLMFTHSGNQRSGAHYVAFDDFCLVRNPSVPCPEMEISRGQCIPDVNGDGIPDYRINVNITNTGSIHFTTSCGSITPASITGVGSHSVTVVSDGTCLPFNFSYYILDNNQVQCIKEYVYIILPHCTRGLRNVGQANVFPNPVADYVQVNWSTENIPDKLSIQVFNANGIEVQSISAINGHEGQLELDTKALSTGLYFIKIEGENYQVDPIKFVKTKP